MPTLDEIMAAIGRTPITPTKPDANKIRVRPEDLFTPPLTNAPFGLIPSALSGYNPLVVPMEPTYPAAGKVPIVAPPPVTPPGTAITPVMPDVYGASASVSGVPNVTIPDVAIPDAPVMSGGMTVEQAIAMGQALAPNVNLQPLTQTDIFGSADPRATIGLLPEHLKTLVDMRAGARTQKANEDAAAVALAKQTQGLDVAHDVMKKASELQAHKDIAVYGAKAAERTAASKANTERAIEQAKVDVERLKLVYGANNLKANTNKDKLEQLVSGLKIQLLTNPNANLTEQQKAAASYIKEMTGPEATTFKADFENNLAMLPPEMQAKFRNILSTDTWNVINSKILSMTPAQVGLTHTPKPGGK